MKNSGIPIIGVLALALLQPLTAASAGGSDLGPYNITWTNQSTDSVDSMPLAGGDLGLNVWVEDGDLLFLIGSPNCLDENGMQVKLGLVRLRLSSRPPSHEDFRQELNLARSEIVVSGRIARANRSPSRCGARSIKPVIHAGIDSERTVHRHRSLRNVVRLSGERSPTAACSG